MSGSYTFGELYTVRAHSENGVLTTTVQAEYSDTIEVEGVFETDRIRLATGEDLGREVKLRKDFELGKFSVVFTVGYDGSIDVLVEHEGLNYGILPEKEKVQQQIATLQYVAPVRYSVYISGLPGTAAKEKLAEIGNEHQGNEHQGVSSSADDVTCTWTFNTESRAYQYLNDAIASLKDQGVPLSRLEIETHKTYSSTHDTYNAE
jgi:hypothetical protein